MTRRKDDLNNKQVIGMTCTPLGGNRILQRFARALARNCRIHLCWYGIRYRCDIISGIWPGNAVTLLSDLPRCGVLVKNVEVDVTLMIGDFDCGVAHEICSVKFEGSGDRWK